MSSAPQILCGTDFSTQAQEAATVAALLAKRLKVNLVLAHAGKEGLLPAPRRSELSRDPLHQEAERLRALGAAVDEEHLNGRPADALVDFARREHPSLLVVSTLGQISPSRLLVGSVAETVAQRTPAPTLVVRSSEPFRKWLERDGRLRVLVAVDFTTSSEAALQWLSQFRQAGRCEVVAVHIARVETPAKEKTNGNAHGNGHGPDLKCLERDLKKKVRHFLPQQKFRLHVVRAKGGIHVQLLEIARETKADLMVVGTHQRHGLSRYWHGSVSCEMLKHLPISAACVPAAGLKEHPKSRIPHLDRVLATTDFSEGGDHAIPFAYAALPRGGVVHLVHVMRPLLARDQARPLKVSQHEQLRDEAAARLRSLVPLEADARGIDTRIEILENRDPARAICQVVERIGCDLICLASHGSGGFPETLLGPVALAVVRRTHLPHLIVRPPQG